jgi:hypothetical protein
MAKIQISRRTHPLYDENVDKWDLYRNASKGGDDFVTSDNLFSHRLEQADDYDERLERAYYLNFCDAVPNIYNAYIFKEKVERSPDDSLNPFRRNTDGRGSSISDFISKIGYFSKVFGAIHVLVDMPSVVVGKNKITKRFARENKLYPYCSIIYPHQLKDWSLDSEGNFRWVLIESEYFDDEDPDMERESKTHYKLITTTEWRIEDDEGNPAKFSNGAPNKGTNELGIVPMATLYHRDIDDDRIGESMLKDIVHINRAILNWCSCIDEQIERQTFSQLVVPDDGSLSEARETGDDPLRRIGTASAWTFNADAKHPPSFISPNVENIQTIWGLVLDHIKEIFRLAGLIGSSEDLYTVRSGRAAQMGFLGVNSALAETAAKYQKMENDISKLAYMQLGKSPDDFEEVKYPSSFDLTALTDELDSYFRVMERNFSLTLNKTIQRNIARKAIPLAPQSIRGAIEAEIESGTGIVESLTNQREMGGEGKDKTGQDGNPNSDLNKTFKSKITLDEEQTSHRREK